MLSAWASAASMAGACDASLGEGALRLTEQLAAAATELAVFRGGETAVRAGARQGRAAAAAKAVGSRVLEVATGTLHGHAL